MKNLLAIIFSITVYSYGYSQELKWIDFSDSYIDLVDTAGNIYIASSPYGVADIDPGPDTVNIDINIEGTFFVKYDTSFNIVWYNTSKSPEWAYRNSIMTNNPDNELFVLTNDKNDYNNSSSYYIAKYTQDNSLVYTKKAFWLERGYGSILDDIYDIFTDTASNIWISGFVKSRICFGNESDTLTVPDGLYFIAKYDNAGELLSVIHRGPDFSTNAIIKTNYKIDTCGSIYHTEKDQSNSNFYYFKEDISGITTKVKLFDYESLTQPKTHIILVDSGNFLVVGTFSKSIDFDNSENEYYLVPKGNTDIYIAKYNHSGNFIDAWQIGGSGSLGLSDNGKFVNNNLILSILSEGSSVIDFKIGTDTQFVEISADMVNVCYDMSVYVPNETFEQEESNDDLVVDIAGGALGSYPQYLVNFSDTLYFVANDGTYGYEVWKSDGTVEGTTLVKNLELSGSSFYPAQRYKPDYPVIANRDFLFIFPDTLSNANTAWKTKGDSLTFSQLAEPLIYNKFLLNNKLYIRKESGDFLVTDGTQEGTEIRSFDLTNMNSDNIVFEDTVMYYVTNPYTSSDVCKFDGTTSEKLFTIYKPVYGLEKFQGRFYFYELNTYYNIVPKKLCSIREDGTDYQVILEFNGNETRFDEASFFIRKMSDLLLFIGYDDSDDLELWTTDGTTEHTQQVKDINPVGALHVNNLLFHPNGILFFSADDGHGNEIYQTDGTNAGTMRLRGLNPFGDVNYNSMAIVNDVLYFGATNDKNGSELWEYRLIQGINVSGNSQIFSADSSVVEVHLDIDITPEDATDTLMTFNLADTSIYTMEADSTGKITLIKNAGLKSSATNDTVNIAIMALDGSGTQSVYQLVLGNEINSIDILYDDGLNIWPNPVRDILYFTSENYFTGNIYLFDITGKKLMQNSYSSIDFASIDLSSYPEGILIIQFQTKDFVKTLKLFHQ